jgi:5'/3'-nucleotidase SurE
MRFHILALWPLAAHAVNIISSNDDGWAEVNIRALFESLGDAGHSVVVSAPAENQSGTGELCDIPGELLLTCTWIVGSTQKTPTALTKPCEFDSCPSGSPAVGYNASEVS